MAVKLHVNGSTASVTISQQVGGALSDLEPGSGSGSWEVQTRSLREERDALRREEEHLLAVELQHSRLFDTVEILTRDICTIIELKTGGEGGGGGASDVETRLLALHDAVIGQIREEEQLTATQQTLAQENAKLQEARDLLQADIAQMKLDEDQVKAANKVELRDLESERLSQSDTTSLQEKRYKCATLRHRLQTWRTSQRTNESTANIRTWIAQQELQTTKMQILSAAREREKVLNDIEAVRQKTYRLLRLLDRRSNASELVNLLSILGFVTSSSGEVELKKSGSERETNTRCGRGVDEKDSLASTVLSLQLSADLAKDGVKDDQLSSTADAEGGGRQAAAAERDVQPQDDRRRVQSEAEDMHMRTSFDSTVTHPFTAGQLASFKRRKVKWRRPPEVTRTNGQGVGKGGTGVRVTGDKHQQGHSSQGGRKEPHDYPTPHRVPTRGEIRASSFSTPGLRSSTHEKTDLPPGWQRRTSIELPFIKATQNI